jgi:hypothetical protein
VSVDEVRAAVAARHGLGADAASFLTGSTIDELEASAERFARFVDEHRQQAQPTSPPEPISAAIANKQAQKRRLAEMVVGRSRSQPRDEHGRYTGFDGGARRPVTRPADPEAEHNVTVSQLAWLGRTFGRSFPPE